MDGWWTGIDDEILACLAIRDTMTSAEIGHKLGISEAGIVATLTMLAREGRIRIALLEVAKVQD